MGAKKNYRRGISLEDLMQEVERLLAAADGRWIAACASRFPVIGPLIHR
jgi:hypothetical protein